MDSLEQKVDHIGKIVDKLYRVLIGEDISEETSVLNRLKTAEDKLAKIEKIIDRIKWVSIGLLVTSGYGVGQLLKTIIDSIK